MTVAIFHKRTADARLMLEPDHLGELPAWRIIRAIYVTRTLLFVHAVGDAVDMPAVIKCKFHADESPAPTREAWWLSCDLLERILQACVVAEGRWERGEMKDVDYQTMRDRWERLRKAFEGVTHTWDLSADFATDATAA